MILGIIIGFLSSFLPEVIELYKDRQDKKYEIEMFKLQMKYAPKIIELEIKEAKTLASLEADRRAYLIEKPKVKLTGKFWFDFLQIVLFFYNSTVRPTVTYLVIIFYIVIKYTMAKSLVNSGIGWFEALRLIYTNADSEFIAAIVAFWFGNRAIFRLKRGNI